MPNGDGTGPRGLGPMTGKARGCCILKIPDDCVRPMEGFLGNDGRYVVFSRKPEKRQRHNEPEPWLTGVLRGTYDNWM